MFFRQATMEKLPIPAIDRAIPDHLETATFAMG